MDEQRWLNGTDVYPLTRYLRDEHHAARTKAGRRKLRLFNVASFLPLWEVLDGSARRLVEMLEREADGEPVEDAAALRHALLAAWKGMTPHSDYLADLTSALVEAACAPLARAVVEVTRRLCDAQERALTPHRKTHPELYRPWRETARVHAGLVREIFGNPFRLPPARKFPAEVCGLARACYDDHVHYPLLADALADLGEDEAAAHCRQAGHVKGCHVVDRVLGRG
jgi:hypothetical protein